MAPADPLAHRPGIELPSLRDRGLICLPPGIGVRTALEQGCAAKGFQPRIAVEAAAMSMLVRLAANGFGIAVVPMSVASAATDLVTTVGHLPPGHAQPARPGMAHTNTP